MSWSWSIINWLTFLKERGSLLLSMLVAAGISLSGLYTKDGSIKTETLAWAFFGEMVSLLVIRIISEFRGYSSDLKIYPKRPLARGLIKTEEVALILRFSLVMMVLYTVALGVKFNWMSAAAFAFAVINIFSEYYTTTRTYWLFDIRAMLFSHFGGVYFVSLLGGESVLSARPLIQSILTSSGFSLYAMFSEDLDQRILSEAVFEGPSSIMFMTTAFLVGFVASYRIGLTYLVWPLEGILLAGLIFMVRGDKELTRRAQKESMINKILEAISILYLIVCVWSRFLVTYFDLNSKISIA